MRIGSNASWRMNASTFFMSSPPWDAARPLPRRSRVPLAPEADAGPVDAAPISGSGMNCSGYPYMPCSTMSRPASSSSSVTRSPIVALMAANVR